MYRIGTGGSKLYMCSQSFLISSTAESSTSVVCSYTKVLPAVSFCFEKQRVSEKRVYLG